ncbi:hypothetical protein Q5P01_000714 [Channa striata]|uniref:Uncharacterized protein n=1 Tax=Channa striata TaxID=64152 RepID=A0AA88II32_CHASR|nr:hypothetical protein Q5P01_000714 [Channa striata]
MPVADARARAACPPRRPSSPAGFPSSRSPPRRARTTSRARCCRGTSGLRADRVTRVGRPAGTLACGCAGFSLGGWDPTAGNHRPCPVARRRRRAGVPGDQPREPPPPRPGGPGATTPYRSRLRPQIRRDDPLNLSILLSGGKETNQDSLSSGERRGKSPAPNPRPTGGRGKCGVRKTACPVSLGGLSPSDRGSARGRCEAVCPGDSTRRARDGRSVAEDPLAGPSPRRWLALAGRISSAAVRRDRLWVGLERQVGGGWRPRPSALPPLPAPRRFLGPWTKCSLRLSPRGEGRAPAPGATVDRADCPQCAPTASRRQGGTAHVKKKARQGSARCDRQPTRPALKHGPRSLTRARVRGLAETPWRNESEGRRAPAEVGSPPPGSGAPPPASPAPSGRWSVSARDRTRKMVNYAWAGRSQRKLWWRPVAVLTCKSVVRPGYRGERLIEPSSSWFPPVSLRIAGAQSLAVLSGKAND